MQKIYLARPGAQKEGPFSLEQINHYLATKKINDTDFWAWHEGLPAWTPLYSVPGVSPQAWVVPERETSPRTSMASDSSPFRVTQTNPIRVEATRKSMPAAEANPFADRAEPETKVTPTNSPTPKPSGEITASPSEPKTEVEKPTTAPVALSQPQALKPETKAPPSVHAAVAASEAVIAPPAVSLPEPDHSRSNGSDNDDSSLAVGGDAVVADLWIANGFVRPTEATRMSPSPGGEVASPPPSDASKCVVPADNEVTPAASEGESPRTAAAPPVQESPKVEEIFAAPSMFSGKPFAALDQIFVFTTGEGHSAFKSEATRLMLEEVADEKFEAIRVRVPVDVIGGAAPKVLEAIRAGSIPGSIWRALSKIKPSVAQQAHEGAYHLCVRTFLAESKDLVALFLLYNKQKL